MTLPSLRDRDIFALFLPLAITSTMMSISVPVINAGLARQPGPEAHLAAFGLAFALSIFLESPVFALQQATLAWYPGRGPIRPFVGFALGLGLLMTAIEVAVAFTDAGPFLFRTLMGAPEPLIDSAMEALRVGVLFPPLVGVRNALQGILVARRHAAPIAMGTFVRLSTLASVVMFLLTSLRMGAPAAACMGLVLAVFAETVYVWLAILRTPERDATPSPAHDAGRTLLGRIRFIAPLGGTMILTSLTGPAINAVVSRSAEPSRALAAYAVVQSLVWFLASPTLRFSSVTIAMGEGLAELKQLRRFLWRLVGGVCLTVFLITVSPAADLVLRQVIGLSAELADRVRWPLIVLSLQPLITGFIAFNQGILTRGNQTHAVVWGAMSRVLSIGLLGWLGLQTPLPGEVLGSLLLGAAFAAELGALLLMRRRLRGGWWAGAGASA